MFKPTAGELLEGVADGLRQSVLPNLPAGDAHRQLRAALHVLERLRRSWDLLPSYLESDSTDMRQILRQVLAALAPTPDDLPAALHGVARRLGTLRAEGESSVRGVNAPELAAQCSIHAQLQALVAEVDAWMRAPGQREQAASIEQARALDGLYVRMSDRHLRASGEERPEA